MLEFKKPQPQLPVEDSTPRWNIGIDRKQVAVFVAIGVVGGFALGFVTARWVVKSEPRVQQAIDQTAAPGPRVQPPPGAAQSPDVTNEYHRVTRVIRADTVDVEGIGPVRLIGVETPDGKQPIESYAAHGDRAFKFVEKSLLNQDARLEFDPANAGTAHKDDQGQTLAYVYTRDGTMINSEMVKLGLAFVRGFEQFRASNDFRLLERDAVQNSRGVWGPASGSSALTSLKEPPAPSPPDEKPRKLAPLPPSALGANIPALTGGSSPSAPADTLVLVSNADHSYHKSGCQFLGKKKQSLGVSQAREEGYTACSRCFASTVMKAP
jgi:micrococcal nuclease